jgi:hypothetical protein
MNLNDWANWISIGSDTCTLFGFLPEAINTVQRLITKSGLEIKTSDKGIDALKEFLPCPKTRDEQKRCQAILKKHKLPKSVGIMSKSEKDIYFVPTKRIVDKTLNNLHLHSSDKTDELYIGGGYFALCVKVHSHKKFMYGTVIKHKGEIYLLRHPLGGCPYYLAKLDLFINGMIVELDDGNKVGLYY